MSAWPPGWRASVSGRCGAEAPLVPPREGGTTGAEPLPAPSCHSGSPGDIPAPQVPFQPCSCHSGPAVAIPDPTGGNHRPAPLPRLRRAPAQRALPAEILYTQQSRRLKCSFLYISCRLSGFRKFPEPNVILCSIPESEVEVSSHKLWWKPWCCLRGIYLGSHRSPQAFLGFSLMQDLPILFCFHFHICS